MNWKNTRKNLPSVLESKTFLKKLNVCLEEFHFKLEIGTKNVLITSAFITIISTLLGIGFASLIKKYDKEKHAYEIMPIYENKNIVNLHLDSRIKVKVINIFSTIIYLAKLSIKKQKDTSKKHQYLKEKKYKLSYG